MPILYTTEAISTGDGRNGEVHTKDGTLTHSLAIPAEMGGPGGPKTNPEQLFAAGYAACFHNGLRLIAAKEQVRLTDSTVTSTVSLLAQESETFSLAVTLHIHLPGVDQPTADKLVQTTHQVCPYSNATRNNIEVTLNTTV